MARERFWKCDEITAPRVGVCYSKCHNRKGVLSMKKNSRSPLLSWLPLLLLTVLGAVGGYLYYRLVGCASGTCPISSDPFISTVYGSVIGLLLGFAVKPGRKKADG